jgi:integrase
MDSEHGKYVVHWNGQKIKQIHRAFYRAAKEAGVRASPHTLRHTRATWVMQDGDVPSWEAAGHLGMSLKTLQKYAKHSQIFRSAQQRCNICAKTVPSVLEMAVNRRLP